MRHAPSMSTCLLCDNPTMLKFNAGEDPFLALPLPRFRCTFDRPGRPFIIVPCGRCLSLSTCLICDNPTTRECYAPEALPPLTTRPFGSNLLLVDNERISLQANPETLAVAQSRSLEPSNARSRELSNPASLHLSLSGILGRSNAQHRQVDMYTTLVHAQSPMLQPAL